MKTLKVGFVGLSHLGINHMAAAAEKNFICVGVDENQKKINGINQYFINYNEPGLKNKILKNKNKIIITNKFKNLKECRLVFITKDTVTNKNNKPDYKPLLKLIRKTKKNLSKSSVLVILSQIKPGFIRSIKFDHSRLYYQVETLIFGQAINRALNPERIIVGLSNKKQKIKPIYLKYLKKFNCPILKMNYESAEIAKISINILLASTVTTTNLLSQLCEDYSADWYDIIPALKLDRRIGKYAYIKPGLGISGGNIERDIVTVKEILTKNSSHYGLMQKILDNSKFMKLWVNRILIKRKILKKRKLNIGIIGVAYKENTNSLKNSTSIELIQLLNKKHKINIYEPMLKLNIRNCEQMISINKLINLNEIIILMRPWTNKEQIKLMSKYIKLKKRVTVIDPYRVLNLEFNKKNVKYFTIGKN